jgi:ABC-type phosphate transport system substrate-binding protein
MIARWLTLVMLALTLCGPAVSHSGSRGEKPLPPGSLQLRGAGSTFAAPLYKKWLDTYQPRHPETLISYDAIGPKPNTSAMSRQLVVTS